MLKATHILILITLSFNGVCSRYSFQVDCERIIAENAERRGTQKRFKIGYEMINGKKREFLRETYDSLGNIISEIGHHFIKFSYFSKIDYSYNEKNQLIKITDKTNFSKGYFDCTQIFYTVDGKIKSIMHDFGLENELKFDTLHYFYFNSGQIRATFLSGRKDTIYYHYDKYNKLDIACRNEDYLPDRKEYDKNGCLTLYYTQTNERFVETNDTDCNSLTSEWQRKSQEGKWYTSYKQEYVYSNSKLFEVKRIDGKKIEFIQYQYNTQGEITKETKLNKRKKIIWEKYFEFIY